MQRIILKNGRIGLLGTYGNGNLGDQAILDAMLHFFRANIRDPNFTVFSVNPEDIRARCGTHSFAISRRYIHQAEQGNRIKPGENIPPPYERIPVRLYRGVKKIMPSILIQAIKIPAGFAASLSSEFRFDRECMDKIAGLDCLIVTGGGQIYDTWTGAWGHPWTLWKWSWRCRRAKVPFLFLNVGASELSSPLSRLFIGKALSNACYRSFRDEKSRERAIRFGSLPPNLVFADLAFSYPVKNASQVPVAAQISRKGERAIVAINAMSYCDPRGWFKADPEVYGNYVRKLGRISAWLVRSGYQVDLVPTQLVSDPAVLSEIRESALEELPDGERKWIVVRKPESVSELVSMLADAEYSIASRFHGVVLSQRSYLPVIALSYEDKTDALMADAGLAEFSLGIETFSEDALRAAFQRLSGNKDAIRKKLEERIGEKLAGLASQYQAIFQFRPSAQGTGAQGLNALDSGYPS